MADMTKTIHRGLAAKAAAQLGLVTEAQLSELGLSPHTRRKWVDAGRLPRLQRGVFRVGGAVSGVEQLALAACLSLGPGSAASHRCAAGLWGIELAEAVPIELTVPMGRSGRAGGVRIHRSSDLRAEDVTRVRGVPVTKPARTLVDLGAVVSEHQVAVALDDLVGRKIVSLAGVRNELGRLEGRGRAGVGVLRAELDGRGGSAGLSRTRLESLLFDLARRAGLPELVFQHPVLIDGHRRRIDFAIPRLRIAIEVDGYESHSRYDVFEDDRVRGNELLLAGWTVVHFTWHHLRHRPDYVVRTLRRLLTEAA